MIFNLCNKYRLVVFILLALIMWQIFKLLPEKHTKPISEKGIVELEDDKYNKHKLDKIKIRVYYEALCPDSKYFFTEHLKQVAEELAEFVDVSLVPYGKATTKKENGHYIFSCQHGEDECYANKIHACSVESIKNMTTRVQFIECMIRDNMDPNAALKRCAVEIKIDEAPIKSCANHEFGASLLKKHGDDTQIIQPSFIPTVTLNGALGRQGGILKNLLLEVCKLIEMPLPPPCL